MGNYTQEEQNFLVFIQALKYSTIGLKTYVDQCMDDLHGRLKRKIGSNQACSNRCVCSMETRDREVCTAQITQE